jgi:hypothetical protein
MDQYPTYVHSGIERSACSIEQEEKFQRKVEVHVLSLPEQLEVALVFEGFPVWLLGLEPSQSLVIFGYETRAGLVSSLISKGHPGVLVDRLLSRFDVTQVNFQIECHQQLPNALLLVSGTIHCINSVVSVMGAAPASRIIGVLDFHFHGRLRNGRPSGISLAQKTDWNLWTRDWHETVGGSTRFVGLFCPNMQLFLI